MRAVAISKIRQLKLRRGEPVWASYQRIFHLRVIPDIAIASTHEVRYLRYNLDHNLGPAHKEGLERFYPRAFEAGLIEELKPVDYLI